MATISEALATALQHHQAGQLAQAEQIYRRILAARPKQPDALHLLGLVAHQVGQHQIAIDYIKKAIGLKGTEATFHNNLGEAYRALGMISQSVECYRRALELKPNFAEAQNNLGNALENQGNHNEAITCYRRALQLKPDFAEAHNNLGIALKDQGKLDDAVACYRRALQLNLDFAQAHNNLGIALKDQGKLDEAVACYHRALELKPDFAKAHNNLGLVFQDQGNLNDAAECFRRALELKSDFAEAHNNLGNSLKDHGKLNEAIASYHRALKLKPDFAKAHSNLGKALIDQGKLNEAVACFRRTLELEPGFAEPHNNLGVALQIQGNLNEAEVCYRLALKLNPEFAEAHNNLGNALIVQGKLDEAVACFRRALELKPDYVEAHHNLLLGLLYQSSSSPHELREAHAEFNHRFAIPLYHGIQSYPNDRSPGRRLRIGYVSPDFREHVVGRNVWPLFREHDHEQFEIFGYANSSWKDEFTTRFQSAADTWREVAHLNDDALAQRIRDDQIDILVDLALHTPKNRLLVFARKPAPVQVTFAGYPGTTGLTAVDYRLTDPHLDPPSQFDHCYCEQSIRLPTTWWCYDPQKDDPAVNSLPANEQGVVTFGCLNNFCKVNEPTLKLWAKILLEFPRSQLLLLSPADATRQHTLALLAQEGIPAERVAFVARQPRPQYLELYHGIDIGLDTLPYNGHTTSLDSYWMGVPVVTLAGQTVVGRAGLSQLTNLGLPELIAQTPEQFVKIAVALAIDLPRLAHFRATLRQRMQSSPLMDAPGFSRGIEAAYRTMWQRWCGQTPRTTLE